MSTPADLTLTPEERVARARADLRIGAPVALVDAEADGQAGALVLAAETASPARLAALAAMGAGTLDLALTHRRAETLMARAYDGDLARVILDGPDDGLRPRARDTAWIRATADPSIDLATPLKGPYPTRREGNAGLHRLALALVKQARLLPAVVVARWDDATPAIDAARGAGLAVLDAATVAGAAAAAVRMRRVSGARVPLRLSEAGRVHVFRPDDGGEEHYAVEIGRPDRGEAVLARLHSACFTGDVIGSLKCDCGPQLNAALEQIAAEGAGVLLYMNQEGRGIGLANKMRAYALQDEGLDTVEANHRLGFEDDERDFRLGAAMLVAMGFSSVRLMTNNPGKIAMMDACGVRVVERVALRVGENPLNARYLATKARKSGHLL
ncbi:MAG: GTP cyclohydrolase II [Pseudomonadota bacterium]